MENHYELSDEEFEHQFQHCLLDPAHFSHEAHLRLAWIHIRKYGIDQALINIEKQLRDFVSYAGASDKYHQTITIAAINAVNHFIIHSKTNDFAEFIQKNSNLKHNFKALINSHYSYDIFRSEKAKNVFIEPDLQPFI